MPQQHDSSRILLCVDSYLQIHQRVINICYYSYMKVESINCTLPSFSIFICEPLLTSPGGILMSAEQIVQHAIAHAT